MAVRPTGLRASLAVLITLAALAVGPRSTWAQQQAEPIATGSGPTISDSGVGYIDYAIPANIIRMRVDAAYGNNRPTRAEFFYAQGKPAGGPGSPLPETSVDYQDITTYMEYCWAPRASTFIEMPVRFLNPQINANAWGYADMNAGFKVAVVQTENTVGSFQLRTYIPTGDAAQGLGTRHVSLEPSALVFHRLSEKWRVESEFRYWAPIGGTDFAGDVVRYGVGVNYGRRCPDRIWVSPVAELVGWTVLSGKELVVPAPGATPSIQSAGGDTIVNVKLGVRVGGRWGDIYSGYGRPLTGAVWYEDIWRTEFRLRF